MQHGEKANEAMKLQKERAQYLEQGLDENRVNLWYALQSGKSGVGNLANIDLYGQVLSATQNAMTRKVSDLQSQIPTLRHSDLSQPAREIEQSFQGLGVTVNSVDSAFNSAAFSVNAFSDNLQATINKLNTLPNFNQQTPPQLTRSLQPNFQLQPPNNPAMAEKLKLAAQKVSAKDLQPDVKVISALAPLNDITRELAELTKIAGSIAQEANNRQSQPPNITVSPTIHVNLGGAYVFDNAMKKQLADDITTEVANAVESAVNKGIRQNTSFAN